MLVGEESVVLGCLNVHVKIAFARSHVSVNGCLERGTKHFFIKPACGNPIPVGKRIDSDSALLVCLSPFKQKSGDHGILKKQTCSNAASQTKQSENRFPQYLDPTLPFPFPSERYSSCSNTGLTGCNLTLVCLSYQ